MIGLLLALSPAWAQDYAFPSTPDHYEFFYPTAYKDHGGLDWSCGTIRYDGHSGSDFGGGSWDGMDAGRDLTAAAPGLVTYTLDGLDDHCTSGECGASGLGNQVWIRHPDGKETAYGHMKTWSVAVQEGDWVDCGQPIGQMGSSGWSTGPHVHFAVWSLDGTWHDPFWGDCSSPPSYWVEQGAYDDRPGLTCDDPVPTCQPVDTLACGQAIDARNDDAGSTTQTVFYGCDDDLASTGAEISWTFATDRDEEVRIALTGLSADLDLYVLESPTCDASDCVDVSRLGSDTDEEVIFQAIAGEDYVIVVDGFEGATSDFVVRADCEGSYPVDEDTDVPVDTDTTPTDSDAPADTDLSVTETPAEGGCGCATVNPIGGWILIFGLAGLLGRYELAFFPRARSAPSGSAGRPRAPGAPTARVADHGVGGGDSPGRGRAGRGGSPGGRRSEGGNRRHQPRPGGQGSSDQVRRTWSA